MATTIEDIVLRFKTVGTEGIKSAKNAVNDLKNDISDFSKTGGPLQNTLNGIIGKLGPIGLAAGVAGAAFAALGKQALTMAGDLEDIAGATGISTGKIDNFANSLIFAGGKAQDASNILTKLNQSVQDAASGNENLQKAFRNMGIALADANGNVRSTSDILDDITKKFQSGDLSAKEYGSAIDILGKNIRALDLAKLNSADNPAVTEATKNIDAFNDELDKLQMIINEKIVLAFGSFAKTINEGGISGGLAIITEQLGLLAAEILNLPTDAIAGFLNLFGANIQNQAGLGDGVKKLVEQAKQARLAAQAEAKAAKEAQEKLAGGSTANRPGPDRPAQRVETPEATLKAIEDSKNRIRQSGLEAARQAELSNANQIGQIEIAAKFDAAKAKAEIDNKERLSSSQKAAEYAAKEKEIFTKRDVDIAKARRDLSVRIAAEEIAQAEQNAKELAAYYQQVDQARLTAFDQVDSIKQAREELERRVDLEATLITLSDREIKNAQELFDLEEARLKAVTAIAAIQNLPYTDRLAEEKKINAEYDLSREKILKRQNTEFEATRSFEQGWGKALADYTESSQNAFKQAGALFQRVTGGMEDAVVDFARTGKFEFKGFMASILEDLLRSQVRQLIAGLFGARGGGGSGGLFGGSIIPGFLAKGGPAIAGNPYIVGERGPELFVPNASGTVIPNGQFGGGGMSMVTYNINAVDTNSFKQLVARDPGFIFAVTEQGRKTLPQTRR
jgi:lambda family phage tail tape measure protein